MEIKLNIGDLYCAKKQAKLRTDIDGGNIDLALIRRGSVLTYLGIQKSTYFKKDYKLGDYCDFYTFLFEGRKVFIETAYNYLDELLVSGVVI